MRRAVAAVLTWLVQRACGLLGHDFDYDRDQPGRLGVICAICGWQSKGIGIEGKKAA